MVNIWKTYFLKGNECISNCKVCRIEFCLVLVCFVINELQNFKNRQLSCDILYLHYFSASPFTTFLYGNVHETFSHCLEQ